ncbi:MAG: autotransporter assembly complex protein TamA [Legionella sp.]
MKKTIYLILFITCFALFAKNNDPSITVYGVSGKVEANVEKRLSELQKLKPLSEFQLDELKEHVIQAIQPFGYFQADVRIQRPNAQKLIVMIHTGPQIHISRVRIELIGEGSYNQALLAVIKDIPLHKGEPLFTEQYEQAKLKLIDTAENQGFLHARFKKSEILIDEESYTAEITLILETGHLYYFGQVQFNPTYINPKLLHRFVPFHPGQIYSGDKVLQLNNDLSNSGYFSSVLVKPEITDDTSVPIQIRTEPASKYSYTLGAGYGTDTGARGRAALHVVPVNRHGDKFNLMAQGSFVQNALQAQYVMPGKNQVTDQYTLTGNFSNLNYTAGYSNSFLVSFAQQHRVKDYQRTVSLNTLYEGFHYTLQQNTKQFLLYPKATLSFSKTKDLLFSPSGYNITLNGLVADKILLSTINFAQASLEIKAAIRIDPLRLRLYGHAIQGFTAINDINQQPLSLALLLGGTDNLKAFSFNSIGPGRLISYAGFEIQKETRKNWYLIAFYDAGSVYNPAPMASYYDAGGGLMWVSPIGPIKVGLAQPLTNRWQRDSNGPRLVISMGPDL